VDCTSCVDVTPSLGGLVFVDASFRVHLYLAEVTRTALFRSSIRTPSLSISISSNRSVFLNINRKCEQKAAVEMRL